MGWGLGAICKDRESILVNYSHRPQISSRELIYLWVSPFSWASPVLRTGGSGPVVRAPLQFAQSTSLDSLCSDRAISKSFKLEDYPAPIFLFFFPWGKIIYAILYPCGCIWRRDVSVFRHRVLTGVVPVLWFLCWGMSLPLMECNPHIWSKSKVCMCVCERERLLSACFFCLVRKMTTYFSLVRKLARLLYGLI